MINGSMCGISKPKKLSNSTKIILESSIKRNFIRWEILLDLARKIRKSNSMISEPDKLSKSIKNNVLLKALIFILIPLISSAPQMMEKRKFLTQKKAHFNIHSLILPLPSSSSVRKETTSSQVGLIKLYLFGNPASLIASRRSYQ